MASDPPPLENGRRDGAMGLTVKMKESLERFGLVAGERIRTQNFDGYFAIFGSIFEWQGDDVRSRSFIKLVHQITEQIGNSRHWARDLNGEFVIAVWDERLKQLSLVTDHAGTRPIYYFVDDQQIAFSTDIESLLPYCKKPFDLHDQDVQELLTGTFKERRDRTMIREIKRVPPASVATFSNGSVGVQEYWRLRDAPPVRHKSHDDYYAQAKELLSKAIALRVPNAEVFGVHVSGGLDSSAIAAVACRERTRKGQSLPLGYGWQPVPTADVEPLFDQEMIRYMCESFDIKREQISAHDDIFDEFMSFDPVTTPISSDLMYELAVMKTAQRSGVNHILSGWGGDQVFSFSGYSAKRTNLPRFLARTARQLIFEKSEPQISFTKAGDLPQSRIERARFQLSRRTTRSTQLSKWNMGAMRSRMECLSVVGTNHDIQYFYPLLDRPIVEFAVGVPAYLYRQHGMGRMLMREAMKGDVPDKIRLNTDKSEPARVAHSLDLFEHHADRWLKALEAGRFTPSRADFVCLPKLKDALAELHTGRGGAYANIAQACSFCRIHNQFLVSSSSLSPR